MVDVWAAWVPTQHPSVCVITHTPSFALPTHTCLLHRCTVLRCRYFRNDQWWAKNKDGTRGPIFFYFGNEDNVELYVNHTGESL